MLQTFNATRTHILLYLPDPCATIMLNAFLTSNGFAVTTTYLLSEFAEAATLGSYSVVITSTALAGRIRDISALPIIDISAFMLSTEGGIGQRDSKSLDEATRVHGDGHGLEPWLRLPGNVGRLASTNDMSRRNEIISDAVESPSTAKRSIMRYEMAGSDQPHILIVEDDPDIAGMLVDLVKSNGFGASSAASGIEMDRLLLRHQFDLIVLDAMLPGEDGFGICRRLRSSGSVPILMLTARREDIDRILGLELGADDYVTKPFNSRELMARIKSILRRASYGHETDEALVPMAFSGWRIDPKSRQLQDPDGTQVSMTTAEFDVLLAFCLNPNKVLTREQLLSMTHAGSAGPVERSIDAHISRVRQKIEPNLKDPTFIKTVRLGGYLFASKVERLP